jgi:hypothetical protein
MEASQRDIEVALRLLQSTRERGRRCYEKHKEERKEKRRAYYHAKKESTRSTQGERVVQNG